MGNKCFLTLRSTPLWVLLRWSSAAEGAIPDSLWGMNLKYGALTKVLLAWHYSATVPDRDLLFKKSRCCGRSSHKQQGRLRWEKHVFYWRGRRERRQPIETIWTWSQSLLFLCLMCVREQGASAEREMCERVLLGINLFLVTPVAF